MHQILDVRRALAGRHILVTGVTGFLGKVWLSWLLHTVPEIGRVTVVVRPRPGATPWQRFSAIADTNPCFRPLKAAHGDGLADFLSARVDVVRGNIEKPLLGLGPAVIQRLTGQVDAVLHFAGLTDFEAPPSKAVSVNVRGAQHAADLAVRLGAKHVHCSTAFVAGCADGDVPERLTPGVSPNGTRFDPEAELTALAEAIQLPDLNGRALREAAVKVGVARAVALGWPNIYTYTKGLAEHALTLRDDVSLTVVRPAILECATHYPFEGWNEGLNTSGPLSWLISTAFRDLPAAPDHAFDVVPIDDAAKGFTLALAAAIEGRAAPVFHIASSGTNPLTFARTIELDGLASRRYARKHGTTGWRDWLLPHLDPVPRPTGGALSIARLRTWAQRATRLAAHLTDDPVLGDTARRFADKVTSTDRQLQRVEDMLRLYRPFIHDYDYRFSTGHLTALTDALPPEDRKTFGFDLTTLDWCWYWVDVEVPGLRKWSIPLLDGKVAPLDKPSVPPLSLDLATAPPRSRSQAVSR